MAGMRRTSIDACIVWKFVLFFDSACRLRVACSGGGDSGLLSPVEGCALDGRTSRPCSVMSAAPVGGCLGGAGSLAIVRPGGGKMG